MAMRSDQHMAALDPLVIHCRDRAGSLDVIFPLTGDRTPALSIADVECDWMMRLFEFQLAFGWV